MAYKDGTVYCPNCSRQVRPTNLVYCEYCTDQCCDDCVEVHVDSCDLNPINDVDDGD